jgi:hypothetical protein
VEVGYYVPYIYDKRERPAKGGVSIGHLNVTAGTLGGLVCGPAGENAKNSILILSNNHVLAAVNQGQKGDHIVQPGTLDSGSCHNDCIATLERFVHLNLSAGAVNYVDCAVAKPYNDSDVSFEVHDIGVPSLAKTHTLSQKDVVNAIHVQKTGRTTQHTVGYVSAIDWKGTVHYDWTPVYFENQIVVESLDGHMISQGGDSGSLVLTMDNKICGLLFAGPTSGTHYIANHISEVFNRLNVKLCCAISSSEAVRDSSAEKFLPGMRKFRDKFRRDKKLAKYFEIYDNISGKFLEAIVRKPELGVMTRTIIEAIGKAVQNPRQKIDSTTVKLAIKVITVVSSMNRGDREFLNNMQKVEEIVKKSENKTLKETLKILRE